MESTEVAADGLAGDGDAGVRGGEEAGRVLKKIVRLWRATSNIQVKKKFVERFVPSYGTGHK